LLRDIQSEDLIGRSVVSRHEEVDLTPVRGKSVLVTGAAGSIGSELSRQLCTYAPTQLILLDVNESGLHDLYVELEARYPYLELIPVLTDITNRCEIEAVYNAYRPQVVFHSAAYKHVPLLEAFPQKAVNNNVLGTLNVARFARAFNVERFVLISTDKAVNPSNVMGASKRICEMIVATLSRQAQSSTLFTTVRFGNVLGSRGSVVPTFTKQINNGGPITVTHPEMTRYFMSISEAANLVIHAACLTKGGEVFLLKMGEAVRVLDLAERMIRVRGMRPYQDIDIVFTGVRPGEKLHEQLYDGSAESVSETVHPGIVCLSAQSDHYDGNELLAWVEHLERENISQENALELLLWGMSPNEQFAFEVQTEMVQTGAGD
jgi:FlaA1/EpsC-like NDP-sugar epimerase